MEESSAEMKVEHVDESSEWIEAVRYGDEIFETEGAEMLSASVSSEVEYCTVDIEVREKKAKKDDTGYEVKMRMVDCQSEFEIERTNATTESIETTLIETGLEVEWKTSEMSMEFKQSLVEESSEYWREMSEVAVKYEKEHDIVDFGISVETRMAEMSSEALSERKFTDSLTCFEADLRSRVEEMGTEFVCTMVDSESCVEKSFEGKLSSSIESDIKLTETGVEFAGKVVVDCGSEFSVEMSEIGIDESKRTVESGFATMGLIEMVDETSSYELSCCSAECEVTEIEIVEEKRERVQFEMTTVDDEYICREIVMNDIGSFFDIPLVDSISSSYVDFSDIHSEFYSIPLNFSSAFEIVSAVMSDDFISQNFLQSSSRFDVGIQVRYFVDCSDFSQFVDMNVEEFFDHESIPLSEFSEDISQEYLEWSEVDLDLNILPKNVETQTSDFVLDASLVSSDSVISPFISICTNVADETEYIIKFIKSHLKSEVVKTIKELLVSDVTSTNSFTQTEESVELLSWVEDFIGIEEMRRFVRDEKFMVDESQSTESTILRSVQTQSESAPCTDILMTFSAPISITDEFSQFIEEIDLSESKIEMKPCEQSSRSEGQTQTTISESRSTGIQTVDKIIEHFSAASDIFYESDLSVFQQFDVEDSEISTYMTPIRNMKELDDTDKCDIFTQTFTSCRTTAVQVEDIFKEFVSVLTFAEFTKDESDFTITKEDYQFESSSIEEYHKTEKLESDSIDEEIQTDFEMMNRSCQCQTDVIDLSEDYWQNLASLYLQQHHLPQMSVISLSVSCQTELSIVEETITESTIDRRWEKKEDMHFVEPRISVQTSVSPYDDKMFTFETVQHLEARHSAVTESSQTEPIYLARDETESVFEDDIHTRLPKYTMETFEASSRLCKVIDTSRGLDLSIRSVMHPSKDKLYPYNLVRNRNWIDFPKGMYCNPSTHEHMPLELAVELNKVELEKDHVCPDVRKFGLFIVKEICKTERLKVKDVLNTETGDLYDEKSAVENGLILDNGNFFDKQATAEIEFQDAVAGHFIELYPNTEVIDSQIYNENYFKIFSIRDRTTNNRFNFHKACSIGLVNINDLSFRDTLMKDSVNFEEAMKRDIIEVKSVDVIDEFYIQSKSDEKIERRERILSSEGYTPRTQSLASAEHF